MKYLRNNTIIGVIGFWGNAFFVYAQDDEQIVTFTIKPLRLYVLSNNVYYWKREDFYPNENFKVWISP